MTRHAIIEYIKYSLRAKRLHGVHSPFVYSFSEEVLYAPATKSTDTRLPKLDLPVKYVDLILKISEHYHCNNSLLLASATSDQHQQFDLTIFTESNPGTWLQLFNKHFKSITTESVIIVPAIHSTKRHTAKWRRLYTHPKILLSIDVYGIGLIFFRKEFKEQQHFILKY
ncbi:hypothetical protein CJD36_010360 [Flavipsychrobacter stenotrophus]|uniref:Uncharacterized protein n=1 Tax=Flavipsychrobacter stenotrophus TaxID=2077091 RepID=A0A2S7SUS7_9BACT|nr:hypothetical protein CJD36_010360 [Flavipsychrobacter stenotrophus]